jgi:hypothetical protein
LRGSGDGFANSVAFRSYRVVTFKSDSWDGNASLPIGSRSSEAAKLQLSCASEPLYVEDIILKGAWTGPAALSLTPHALAPVADLPVLEVVSAIHIRADLTLGLCKVVHDYLRCVHSQRAAP